MGEGHFFISYSSRDAEAGEAICAGLEARGLRCWIAPRDVEAGAYGASIVRGIRSATGLLFLASENSGRSGHVGRELERAVDAGIPILPLRMDATEFSEEFDYYLAGMHWLDCAGRPPEAFLPELAERLSGLATAAGAAPAASDPRDHGAPGWRDLRERLLDALLSVPAPLVGLSLSAIGAMLLLLSAFLGIGEFAYRLQTPTGEVEKEVGFLWAVNWSIGSLILYPAIAGTGLQALREMNALPARLVGRRMVVDDAFRLARLGFVETEIRRALRTGIGISLGLLAFFLAYSAWEFHVVVGQHYLTGKPFPEVIPIDHPLLERDWSIAALLPSASGGGPAPWANYAFALAAYVWLVGFGSALVLSVFVAFLAAAATVYRLSAQRGGLRIVPDLRDPPGRRAFDPRCGFELFERLLGRSVLVLVLSICALFLVALQNSYIRSADAHVLDYALPDISLDGGVAASLLGTTTARAALSNLNGALASVVGVMLFAAIVFGLLLMLRTGAQQAHSVMVDRIEDDEHQPPLWLEGIGRADLLARLDGMAFWPASWLSLNRCLAILVLAGVSLAFHRIGVVLLVFATAYVMNQTFRAKG